jgi:rhodanese-related sulfurtransferase/polyisoprenoid-binding protein YceI
MKTITRAELNELLDGSAPPVVIDVTPEEYYRATHIAGAKNACVYEVNFLEQAAAAATDKSAALVVYGSSAHSLASTTAAEKLDRAGYSDVRDYRGGIEDWLAAGLPVERGPEPPPKEQPRPGRHEVDTAKSLLVWTGRNTFSTHTGTMRLKEGWLEVTPALAAAGEFILDMESMADTDLTDSALNSILIAHLKSGDFFDTARFPIAKFQLRHVTVTTHARPGSINSDIDGTFTLKGVTEEIGFPALIEVLLGGALSVEAHFDIDRTRWNVLYGSGKFYERLGKHLVHDCISLSLRIITL